MKTDNPTWSRLTEWAKSALTGYVRLKVTFFVLGCFVTLGVQLLSGYWVFTQSHEKLVHERVSAIQGTQSDFEEQLNNLANLFEGRETIADAGVSYTKAAQEYIRSIEGVSDLLPETKSNLDQYIAAIAELRKYYDVKGPLEPGSVEWVVEYGKFRGDYDTLVTNKERYFSSVSAELSDYGRYVLDPIF